MQFSIPTAPTITRVDSVALALLSAASVIEKAKGFGPKSLSAFGRFPPRLLNRRIRPVYLYALPAIILGQTVVMYTNAHNLPYWLKIAHAILSESAKFR